MAKSGKLKSSKKVAKRPIKPKVAILGKAHRDEAKFALSDKVDETLKRMMLDPISELVMYAKGDVVGLGLMSQEELDADEEFNAEGGKVRPSGHEVALALIPPAQRQKAAAELLSYHFPRKKDPLGSGIGGEGEVVHLYLPKNGRDNASA